MKIKLDAEFDVDDFIWANNLKGFKVSIDIPGTTYCFYLVLPLTHKNDRVTEYIKNDICNYIKKRMGYKTDEEGNISSK